MTKDKKRLIVIIAAVAAVVLVGVILLVSLTGKRTVTEISVGRNAMPRDTYVQGQELELSSGNLTVTYSDKTNETLPLDSDGISFSGYDKNFLGKQTVTVAYGGKTTTIEVTVIPRVRIQNATTVYYVGEELDRSRGKLVIANDDATTFDVPLSDASVRFQGFDSSAPATVQTVDVSYRSGTAEYSRSFDIAVYTTDNAKLTPPSKTNYSSHEEFRVNGAYITYSNGDSSYDKRISVTEEMISGIDFSTVTEENSPMTQTGIVTYGGRQYSFTVTVTYSQVTRLQGLLEEYAFEWTEPAIPEIDGAQGERAIECSKRYLNLSQTQRAFIDSDAIQAAVRTAAVYSRTRWCEVLESCKGGFIIDDEGLKYTLLSYEGAATACEAVSDETGTLNSDSDFLNRISELYPNLTVGEERMEDYLAFADTYAENKDGITSLLTFATSLYTSFADVPDAPSDVSEYGSAVDQAKRLITEGDFGSSAYRSVFKQISSWRTNDDLFDIVYAYYTEQGDTESVDELKNLILPSKLNELYENLYSALVEYSDIYVGTESGYASDSTFLRYYYRQARKLEEEIAAGENELDRELYQTLKFDNLLISENNEPLPVSFDELFRFIESSCYYDIFNGVLDDPELEGLWDDYLEIPQTKAEEGLDEKIQAFVNRFGMLSPAQQMCFLRSVNVHYDSYEKLSLDTEVSYTYLIRMLKGHYSEALSDTEFAMFGNLLLAIESYASIGEKETAVTDFQSYLSLVQTAYEALDGKDRFDENFGDVYRKYLGIAELYDDEGILKSDFEVDETWQAVFDCLINEINGMYSAYGSLQSEEGSTVKNAFIRLYASYEAARCYANDILTNAPESVKAAYYHKRITFFEEYEWTLDYAMSANAMRLGVYGYTLITVSDRALWEYVVEDDAFRAFLADAVSIVWTDSGNANAEAFESAVAVMKKFLALTDEQKAMFYQLQGIEMQASGEDDKTVYENHDYYYEGLSAVFGQFFAENESLNAAANALSEAEQAMVVYRSYADSDETEEVDEEALQTAIADARAAMAKLEDALNALSPEDSASFNGYFSESVAYCREVFAELPVAEE